MTTFHMRTDMRTGEVVYIGKSGREVAARDFDTLDARVRMGDAEALAVRRDLDLGVDEHGRPLDPAAVRALAAQQIHDCPECQAARARGEVGFSMGPDELQALADTARRRGDYPSRATRRRKIAKVARRRKIARATRAANR